MAVAIVILAWLVVGASGFVYWWTNEHDFQADDIPCAIVTAALGPLTWFFGWCIHGKHEPSPVLLRRRRR